MMIRSLGTRGFAHDIVAVFFVVSIAVIGTAYYVASKAATPNTGPVTSALMPGTASLCLNAGGKTGTNSSPVDTLLCRASATTQSWQVKTTRQTAVGGKAIQAYSISLAGSGYCVGVNAPHGKLALTPATTPKGRRTAPQPVVQLFRCRGNQASFDRSFQQWAVAGGALVNINPQAVYNGSSMCMTAAGRERVVKLAPCTAGTGQTWALPLGRSGNGRQ